MTVATRPHERVFDTPLGKGRIAPHYRRELEMLLAGEKPAAILELPDDVIRAHGAGLLVKPVQRDWLAARSEDALDQLDRALRGPHSADLARHVAIGLALGYTPADIVAFAVQATLGYLEERA